MKVFVVIAVALAIVFSGIQKPRDVHAGAGEVMLILGLVGLAAYGGHYFSDNYEIMKKKDAVAEVESFKKDINSREKKKLVVSLLNVNF